MKVIVLSDTASINGGAAKVALDGACAMASAGYQVYLVCGVGPIERALLNQPNLSVHCLGQFDVLQDPNRLRAIGLGWWNPRSARYMGELLDGMDCKDTIIHVHSWTKALSSSPVRVALDRGFRVVFTLHDYLVACPTGTLFLQNKLENCTLRPMSIACMCSNCDLRSYQHKVWRIGRNIAQRRFGRIPSGVQHFICPSTMVEDLMRPYLPATAQVHRVPNPIDIEFVPPATVADNDTFMFIGRLTPEKGAEVLARAAQAESVPSRFIGDGVTREAVARANPDAIISGWMSHRDGMTALRAARALVCPSLWYEIGPLVVLEAAANGVPSIVSDTCAAKQSIVPEVTGLVFRSGDENDLRRKLAVLKDPKVATRMGAEAHRRFWTAPGLGIAVYGQRLASTYRSILGVVMEIRDGTQTALEAVSDRECSVYLSCVQAVSDDWKACGLTGAHSSTGQLAL